jgi:hypothetical protein
VAFPGPYWVDGNAAEGLALIDARATVIETIRARFETAVCISLIATNAFSVTVALV